MADRQFEGTIDAVFETAGNWDGGAALPTSGADSLSIQPAVGNDCDFDGSVPFVLASGKTLFVDAADHFNINAAGFTFSAGCIIDIDGFLYIYTDATLNGTINGPGCLGVDGSLVLAEGMTFGTYVEPLSLIGAAGIHTITYNGVTCPDIVVNNAGTTSLTAQDACEAALFTLTDGVYTDGGFAHDIAGNIIITAGTLTNTGVWSQTASGNLKNTNWANAFADIQVADIVGNDCAFTGDIWCKKFGCGDGDVSGAHAIRLYAPVDDFWSQGSGSLTIADLKLGLTANRSCGAIDFSGVTNGLIVEPTATNTLTMTGNLASGGKTLLIRSDSNGVASLDMNGHRLLGDVPVLLGNAAAALKLGEILFGSVQHEIASIQAAKADANGNKVGFGSAYIKASGVILGIQGVSEITFTSDDARIRGGTVTGVNCTGRLWCQPQTVTDGTGNSGDVIFRPRPEGIGMGVAA